MNDHDHSKVKGTKKNFPHTQDKASFWVPPNGSVVADCRLQSSVNTWPILDRYPVARYLEWFIDRGVNRYIGGCTLIDR